MKEPIIPCKSPFNIQDLIEKYSRDLVNSAHRVGDHGLSKRDFWELGVFRGAIERIRGQFSASQKKKKEFIRDILNYLVEHSSVKNWSFAGGGERYDYEVIHRKDIKSIIEAKGCLDGNNTNIFERPPQADEFIIWSLCQNPGADPHHNAWSGIHTRLSAEIIHRDQKVDALIIWDDLCGTIARPCPKVSKNQNRLTKYSKDKKCPPPCIYLFPKTIPDPRNNPSPSCWRIEDLKLIHELWKTFKGDVNDIVSVKIEARMKGPHIERKTLYFRDNDLFSESKWTKIRRAKR